MRDPQKLLIAGVMFILTLFAIGVLLVSAYVGPTIEDPLDPNFGDCNLVCGPHKDEGVACVLLFGRPLRARDQARCVGVCVPDSLAGVGVPNMNVIDPSRRWHPMGAGSCGAGIGCDVQGTIVKKGAFGFDVDQKGAGCWRP